MRFIRATIDGFSALHLPPTQESCEKSFRRRLEMPPPPPPKQPKIRLLMLSRLRNIFR